METPNWRGSATKALPHSRLCECDGENKYLQHFCGRRYVIISLYGNVAMCGRKIIGLLSGLGYRIGQINTAFNEFFQ